MNQLTGMKTIVEDALAQAPEPATAEPMFTALGPHFPLLPPVEPDDELRLPLTKPMAQSVASLNDILLSNVLLGDLMH